MITQTDSLDSLIIASPLRLEKRWLVFLAERGVYVLYVSMSGWYSWAFEYEVLRRSGIWNVSRKLNTADVGGISNDALNPNPILPQSSFPHKLSVWLVIVDEARAQINMLPLSLRFALRPYLGFLLWDLWPHLWFTQTLTYRHDLVVKEREAGVLLFK